MAITPITILSDSLITMQQTHAEERVEHQKTQQALKDEGTDLRTQVERLEADNLRLKKSLEDAHALTNRMASSSAKDQEALQAQKKILAEDITTLTKENEELEATVKRREDILKTMNDKVAPLPKSGFQLGAIMPADEVRRRAQEMMKNMGW